MAELKTLLGDAFKEGMTLEDIDAALKDRKLVDLADGEYVGKKKYEDAVKEREEARRERDEANAKVKDYDALAKYKQEAEAAKTAKEMSERLAKLGAKEDMIDFVKFQVETGKIAKGKTDEETDENIKKFLKENPQYAARKDTEKQKAKPRVSTGSGEGGDPDENGGREKPKLVIAQPWNRHKRF